MREYSAKNKKAWEFDAYEFWRRTSGIPEERAKQDVANPIKRLKWHSAYFDQFENIKVANICGSCGKKAIPFIKI